MPRYRGRPSRRDTMRNYPHVVKIAVPLGGLLRHVDVLYAFHAHHRIQSRHGGWRRDGQKEFVRWCFANANTAAEFATAFGGVVCETA